MKGMLNCLQKRKKKNGKMTSSMDNMNQNDNVLPNISNNNYGK